jgi:glycosyltransferase involved in cell wall biosynthesis
MASLNESIDARMTRNGGDARTLRIAFLGDVGSANTRAWVDALRAQPAVTVEVFQSHALRWPRVFRPALVPTLLWQLRRWLARVRPDVLVGYRTTSYGFLAALTGFRPLVVAAQGEGTDLWPRNSLRAAFKARCAGFALRHADLIHAWGEHMAASMRGFGAAPERLLVMPRGVDTAIYQPPREPRGATEMVVITTRALDALYGHDTILNAVAAVRKRGVPVTLWMAGEGPEQPRLARLAMDLGISPHALFLGRLSVAAVADRLRRAHVYVSTPITEGISASLLEAMASGCLPIVTDLPGNRLWVKDGANGFLVPVGDWKALANKLREAWQRPEWRARAAALNVAEVRDRASASVNAAKFVDAYRRLVTARPRDSAAATATATTRRER